MPSLFVIQGGDQGKRFDLEALRVTVGRDPSNPIQLQDTEVSRRHAELRRGESSTYSLFDLNSSNGTFVNSQRVAEHPLRSGDRVQVGRTLMIYTGAGETQDEDDASKVDIINSSDAERGSRIISSLSQEESSRIFATDRPDTTWLARARSNLQIMYRTALAVSHTLDIDQLLGRILELIFEWVEADRGCVMLVDDESEQLMPRALKNRPGVQPTGKMSISRTILDYVMENREGVVTSDAQDDQRWDAAGSIVKLGIREAICVPMQGRYGIVGIIYIDTYTSPGHLIQRGQANRFTEEHLKLMVAIGHQAALAVEDTNYYSAMVQAERLAAIGQTIAGLSHHIKNILQGIRGGSYLIEEGLNSEEADVVRKGWSIVEKNQEKISRLVLDMLTFSKERQPEMVAADLNTVASDVVELMTVRAQERHVTLAHKPADAMPTLHFDPEAVHHAVLNVVTNAIDACDQQEGQGHVEMAIRYLEEEQVAEVAVRDNGPGIPVEQQKQIFSLFESTKGTRGTGLGLSVSQKIMKEHGGEILVESAMGRGSCFTLRLPLIPPACERSPDEIGIPPLPPQ